MNFKKRFWISKKSLFLFNKICKNIILKYEIWHFKNILDFKKSYFLMNAF